MQTTMRRLAQGVSVLLAVVAMPAMPSPPAIAAVRAPEVECPAQVETVWFLVNELASVRVDRSPDVSEIASALAQVGTSARCMPAGGAAPVPTALWSVDQMGNRSGVPGDDDRRGALEASVDLLLARLLDQQPLLADADSADPAALAAALGSLGEAARGAEHVAREMGWHGLPAVAMLASVKHAALVAQWQLAAAGGTERIALGARIRTEDAATRLALGAGEEAFRSVISASGINRRARVERRQFADGTVLADLYTVQVAAQRGTSTVLDERWDCTSSWDVSQGTAGNPDDPCVAEYAVKREQLFRAAWDAHATVRHSLTAVFDRGYLAARAIWGQLGAFPAGPPVTDSFYLVNNRSAHDAPMCMAAGAGVGDVVRIKQCDLQGATDASLAQHWRFLSGSAILESVATGLCAYASFLTLPVTLGPCDVVTSPAPSEFSPTAWGIHPAGYLVSLPTNCAGPQTDAAGAGLMTFRDCEHERSSRPGGLDAPAAETGEDGIRPTDPTTTLLWHLRAVPEETPPTRLLSVGVTGEGTVASAAAVGIVCGDTGDRCEAPVAAGDPVQLKATPAPGHYFVGWDDGVCADVARTCIVLVDDDTMVGATFAPLRPTAISADPARQVFGGPATLEVRLDPSLSGRVVADVGGTQVEAVATGGRAVLHLPVRTLPPGQHHVVVAYEADDPTFAPSSTLATLTVSKARPRIAVTTDPSRPTGRSVRVRVRVRAVGVRPTGRITVSSTGVRRSARLSDAGTVTVRLRLPAGRGGGVRLAVSYAGDRFVARDTKAVQVVARRSAARSIRDAGGDDVRP